MGGTHLIWDTTRIDPILQRFMSLQERPPSHLAGFVICEVSRMSPSSLFRVRTCTSGVYSYIDLICGCLMWGWPDKPFYQNTADWGWGPNYLPNGVAQFKYVNVGLGIDWSERYHDTNLPRDYHENEVSCRHVTSTLWAIKPSMCPLNSPRLPLERPPLRHV